MDKKFFFGGAAAAAVVILVLLLIAYVVVSGFLGSSDSGVTKVKTNTVVKYVCPSGKIVDDSSGCGTATSTVTTSGNQTVCPNTLPCTCAGGGKPATTSTIKLGPPCETDSECGQVSYGDSRCSTGSVYNMRITPTCVNKHCVDVYSYELKEECADGKECVVGQGCVDEKEPLD